MNHCLTSLSAVVVLLTAFCQASATPIAAGGSVTALPVASTPVQYLSRIAGASFISQAPSGMSSTIQGTYSTSVYKDSANSLCSSAGNCLTFAIQVSNSANSTDGIETVTTGMFSDAFTYNVGYLAATGSFAPLFVNDSATGTMSFRFTSGLNWANMILPGFSSDTLIIQTSATAYTAASVSFQDNQTATVAGFAPAVAVTPEPGSLVLLGTGLVAAATVAGRRRRCAQQGGVGDFSAENPMD